MFTFKAFESGANLPFPFPDDSCFVVEKHRPKVEKDILLAIKFVFSILNCQSKVTEAKKKKMTGKEKGEKCLKQTSATNF